MGKEVFYIKKVQLSNGEVYHIYDATAARITDLDNYLPLDGGTITGNLEVDQKIITNNLQVLALEYITEEHEITNVLVEDSNGEIKKRSIDLLLKDIGGTSYSVNESDGTLILKRGK